MMEAVGKIVCKVCRQRREKGGQQEHWPGQRPVTRLVQPGSDFIGNKSHDGKLDAAREDRTQGLEQLVGEVDFYVEQG